MGTTPLHTNAAQDLRPDVARDIPSDVAHDLSQPLSSISNLVEVCALQVRTGAVEPEKLLHLLSEVAVQSIRAADIVARAGNLAGKCEPDLAAVNLGRIVADIPHLMQQEFEDSGVALRLDLPDQPLPIFADRLQIELVLVNLVRNAMDSIRESGCPVRMVEIGLRRNGDNAEAMVRDSGQRVPSAGAGHPGDGSAPATPHGLGLGLSRTILEAHFGSIQVEAPSDGGPGAVVRCTIPLAPSPPVQGAAA